MRLQQFLSRAGVWSRREAEKHIVAGHVRVNGIATMELGSAVNDVSDIVEVSSNDAGWRRVKLPTETITYALNKTIGYATTVADPHAEKTVLQLVPKQPRVVPIGRLDKDSQGLLLLSNDGDLVHRLTHPSAHVPKTYLVTCSFAEAYRLAALKTNLAKLRSGVMLDGTLTAAARVRLIGNPDVDNHTLQLEMILHEGRNRQIRRMCQKVGLNVVQLSREAIGGLELSDLKLAPGKYRALTHAMLIKLFQ